MEFSLKVIEEQVRKFCPHLTTPMVPKLYKHQDLDEEN